MPVQFLKDLKNHDAETMCACQKSAISYGKKEDSEGENTDLLKGIAKHCTGAKALQRALWLVEKETDHIQAMKIDHGQTQFSSGSIDQLE